MANTEGIESYERFRSRIAASENMYKIVDSIFIENPQVYIDHPDKLLEVLKECILPFRKTCKSLNTANSSATDGELVRMRCMLRESTGYECFPLDELKNTNNEKCCGFLRNSFEDDMLSESGTLKFGTRYKYVVVPVPGASSWYNETFYDLAIKDGNANEELPVQDCARERKLIAKFVDESCANLKPNNVFDIFGVYDTTVLFDADISDCSDNKDVLCYPSCHSIHVIAYEPVEDHKVMNQEFPLMPDVNTSALSLIRKSLNLLFGDENSAEYLLCHLISKTFIRWTGKPLCSLALNIVNVTDSESIIRHLKFLMPKVLVFKVDEDSLCTDNLVPKMNNELGILEDTVLQFSSGTVFVIDETKFSWPSIANISNQKRAIMRKNLKALRTLVKEQVLEYDYTVYSVTLECDINILILSKELSCLKLELPFTLAIPKQFYDGVDPASIFDKPELIRQCRHTIQVCRNYVKDVSIPDELNKDITDSFVRSRSGGVATGVACDRLHRLLTLTRLCAAADFKLETTSLHWKKAESMEGKRGRSLEKFMRNFNK